MTLARDLDDYVAETELSRDHVANYRRNIRFFGEFLGRPAKRSDLRETTVNRWLQDAAQHRSAATVAGYRATITTLWNWLFRCRKLRTRYDPDRLRRVRVTYPPPRAWSVTQTRILLQAAADLSGTLRNGLLASDLMTAMIHLGYSTGLRLGDQLRIRRCDIDGRMISIIQHKTGVPHKIDIGPNSERAIQPLLAIEADHLVPITERCLRDWTARLFALAESRGFSRQKGQGLGTLRKTGATEVARQNQSLEAAARFLGHKSGTEMARIHYVDPGALGETPTPPSLLNELSNPTRSQRNIRSNRESTTRTA